MRMTLQDWLRSSWLVEHRSSPQEIKSLLTMADRDLKSCRASGLDPDWQLAIAYNAALQSATAALAAAGYRVARGESHHHRTVQSLEHTIGCDAALVSTLDKFRKKRNIIDYERAGIVSDQEAREMVELARDLRGRVESHLRKEHPELLDA
jgi:hypothetical protein